MQGREYGHGQIPLHLIFIPVQTIAAHEVCGHMEIEVEAPLYIGYMGHGVEIARLELGPASVCDFKKMVIVPLFEHLKLNLSSTGN
jgi:hypothetical protein